MTMKDEQDQTPPAPRLGLPLAELHAANAELLRDGQFDPEVAGHFRDQLAFAVALTDSLAEGVCALDRECRLAFANPVAERLLGRSEADLIGRDAREIMPLPFREVIRSGVARRDDDVAFTREDGSALAVACSAAPIVSGSAVVGAVVVFRDIAARKRDDAIQQRASEGLEERVRSRTAALHAANAELQAELAARRRAEADVRERETRLRLVLEQAPVVIWATDGDLRCTFAAGANLVALGLDPDRMVGLHLSELVVLVGDESSDEPDDRALLAVPAHRRALGGESSAYPAERQGHTYQVYVEPLRDLSGSITGTIAIAQDITELSLRRLHDEFIATVSHQLLTPLAAARAGLGLLESGAADRLGADERRLLGNIGRNVGRLGIHLNDLLTLNQLKSGTLTVAPVVLDLRAVVSDAMGVVYPLLQEKGQALAVDLPEPLPVAGDAEELTQAVINLLANAHRHTPGGARVTIAGRNAGGEVMLTVADTGPGIPAGAREAIFQRFHRLAIPGGTPATGSGLGLAIVRGIVELHGGRAWAEGAPGGGAAFHIALPMVEDNDVNGAPR
jgi:PAS domain S-box-containing protein